MLPAAQSIFMVVVLLLSLYGLGKSAEYLITTITRGGFALRLSQFITGFLILGIATSTPEILIAINSSVSGIPQLSLGNLLGANIVLLTLIAGGTAILARGVTLKSGFQAPIHLAQVALLIFSPIIVLIDSHISRLDSLFLLALYAGYIVYIYRLNSQSSPPLDKQLLNHKFIHSALLSVIGLLGVIICAKGVVTSALTLGQSFGLPPLVVGLLILSVGTNLPEISIAITAVKKHHSNLVLGDVLGSAATNTAVVGLLGLITPFTVDFGSSFAVTSLFLIASLVLFVSFTRSKDRLTPYEGASLMALYVAYVTAEIVSGSLRL